MSAARPEQVTALPGGEGWARPIVKESLADAALRTIRAALMEGHLKPGEPLSLRPMSQRFGISVTPMREALLRLVSANALAMDDRGTVIVPDHTRFELTEIWDLRADIEAKAVTYAAARITDDEIAALEAHNQRIVEAVAVQDFTTSVRENTRWHLALAGMSGRPLLAELIESLWVRTGPILWHSHNRAAPRWTASRHNQIIAALRARDGATAASVLKAEIHKGLEGYVQFARPSPSDGGEEPPPEG